MALRRRCPEGSVPPKAAAFEYLMLEPKAGSCLIWPSFVPHFVLPVAPARDDGGACREKRVSVAFNVTDTVASCTPPLVEELMRATP